MASTPIWVVFCSGEICRCLVEHFGLMHSEIHGIELEHGVVRDGDSQSEFDTLSLDELYQGLSPPIPRPSDYELSRTAFDYGETSPEGNY